MRRTLFVVAAVAVLAGACRDGAGTAGAPIGRPAPTIDAPGIVEGQRVKASEVAGGRGYLVNFWGSWCEPCKRELPRLAAAHTSGTVIVGVAVRSSNRLAREQLIAAGAGWPSATDPDGEVAAAWGVASGFPVTIAVDPGGIVRGRHFGELSEADVTALAALTR